MLIFFLGPTVKNLNILILCSIFIFYLFMQILKIIFAKNHWLTWIHFLVDFWIFKKLKLFLFVQCCTINFMLFLMFTEIFLGISFYRWLIAVDSASVRILWQSVLGGMWSTPSLPLLPCPLWARVVAPLCVYQWVKYWFRRLLKEYSCGRCLRLIYYRPIWAAVIIVGRVLDKVS